MAQLTKEEILNQYGIKAEFTGFKKSEVLEDNYKSNFRMIYAGFEVTVKGNKYPYTQSAVWTKENLKGFNKFRLQGIDKKNFNNSNVLYVSEDFIEGALFVEVGNSRKPLFTSMHRTDKLYFSDLSKVTVNEMGEDELLFCLWAILQDALLPIEYFTADEFIVAMGYDSDLKSIRKGEEIFNACRNTYIQLGLGEAGITALLENLAALGIE